MKTYPLAPSTIVRLAAVRRLADEAAGTGLMSPELAGGIPRGGSQGIADCGPFLS